MKSTNQTSMNVSASMQTMLDHDDNNSSSNNTPNTTNSIHNNNNSTKATTTSTTLTEEQLLQHTTAAASLQQLHKPLQADEQTMTTSATGMTSVLSSSSPNPKPKVIRAASPLRNRQDWAHDADWDSFLTMTDAGGGPGGAADTTKTIQQRRQIAKQKRAMKKNLKQQQQQLQQSRRSNGTAASVSTRSASSSSDNSLHPNDNGEEDFRDEDDDYSSSDDSDDYLSDSDGSSLSSNSSLAIFDAAQSIHNNGNTANGSSRLVLQRIQDLHTSSDGSSWSRGSYYSNGSSSQQQQAASTTSSKGSVLNSFLANAKGRPAVKVASALGANSPLAALQQQPQRRSSLTPSSPFPRRGSMGSQNSNNNNNTAATHTALATRLLRSRMENHHDQVSRTTSFLPQLHALSNDPQEQSRVLQQAYTALVKEHETLLEKQHRNSMRDAVVEQRLVLFVDEIKALEQQDVPKLLQNNQDLQDRLVQLKAALKQERRALRKAYTPSVDNMQKKRKKLQLKLERDQLELERLRKDYQQVLKEQEEKQRQEELPELVIRQRVYWMDLEERIDDWTKRIRVLQKELQKNNKSTGGSTNTSTGGTATSGTAAGATRRPLTMTHPSSEDIKRKVRQQHGGMKR